MVDAGGATPFALEKPAGTAPAMALNDLHDAGGATPFALKKLASTAPAIALNNLNGEIADREKRPENPTIQVELVTRYLMRSQFAGRISDLESAEAVSERLLAAHPNDAASHLTRASALSGIHEFARAIEELDRAGALKADGTQAKKSRAFILLAVGKPDDALALLPDRNGPVLYEDLVALGAVEAQREEPLESERLFTLARSHYRDVSPFTLAWMDFERSRALEFAGERTQAKAYLTEAVEALPVYAHAVVHLAAQEPADRALERLQSLETTSDDPDVLAGEADALRRLGRHPESDAMTKRARARYEELLARWPLAFADHAAAFFLGVGRDTTRALSLAKVNAANRPTQEALELWLTAAQAANAASEVCAAAARVVGSAHVTASFRERATSASKGCR